AGVVLNLLLLFAIRRFTNKSLGAYKHLQTIFASFDVFLCILQLAVEPKVVIRQTTFGVVTDTPLKSRRVTSFFCACMAVPFALMNIHFLYRYWSVRRPHLIPLFSDKKFIVFLGALPVGVAAAWYLLCVSGLNGEIDENGTKILSAEYNRRYGKVLWHGWIVMDYWASGFLDGRLLLLMCCFDAIMLAAFTVALTLASLTFFHIKRAEKFSVATQQLQLQLFIVVSAQTFVPLVSVYIPTFCAINFAAFRLPIRYVDTHCMTLLACFPAWNAVIMIGLMKDYR
ncbi:hypothetical protein PFISCL1PPCAC_13026, partial [Pristionchus fissidentatus]